MEEKWRKEDKKNFLGAGENSPTLQPSSQPTSCVPERKVKYFPLPIECDYDCVVDVEEVHGISLELAMHACMNT